MYVMRWDVMCCSTSLDPNYKTKFVLDFKNSQIPTKEYKFGYAHQLA